MSAPAPLDAQARRHRAGNARARRGIRGTSWPAGSCSRLLARTRGGELEIVEGGARLRFGERVPGRPLRATVEVRSARFYRRLLGGSVGLCESYMDGLWECEDLVALTRIAALNVRALDTLRRALAPVLIPVQRWARWLARNTPGRSRRRIAAHYDLGNELFSLFLDETMMYSCAVFDSPESTLRGGIAREARARVREARPSSAGSSARDRHRLGRVGRVCGPAPRVPGDHDDDLRANSTSTPVERVREAGLEDRVTVLLEDYRDLRGRYDKLVSIEMIEAVGWQYFPTFFRRCSALVADDGAMLLQAIVIDDRAYHVEKAGKSFINTYIFPGGCLPSLEIISRSVARVTDFRLLDLEDITAHYATTLERWRERFLEAGERLSELGYDERFRRLWELYLSYCEGGFRERRIQDVQLLFAKPGYRAESVIRRRGERGRGADGGLTGAECPAAGR